MSKGPKNLVVVLQPTEVRLENMTREMRRTLTDAGLRCIGDRIDSSNENEMLAAAKVLASNGAVFSGGSGWPPSEVLSTLKGEGKFPFPFQEVLWRGPGDFFLVTR